ncbi:hypothetical protein B9Z19DRAFT_1122176 [Tuber borchii]|uniref:Uncharacterized protein n=1 Tax=Tuber borchii TaxID=42251 RepID=A0A2T7A111_TUBBO|nr:hypothetical protein B9Z19DRAFT_1122176 [Tuber borchii]
MARTKHQKNARGTFQNTVLFTSLFTLNDFSRALGDDTPVYLAADKISEKMPTDTEDAIGSQSGSARGEIAVTVGKLVYKKGAEVSLETNTLAKQ